MSIEDLFTKEPLYGRLPLPYGENHHENSCYVQKLLSESLSFDMYCVDCTSHSIFQTVRSNRSFVLRGGSPVIKNGEYIIYASCSRDNQHNAVAILKIENLNLVKIGQFPSLADVLTPDLKRYKTAIGEDRVKEWSRAIGLSSHGIGAGSFVYLRRIIESLVEEAHLSASKQTNFDEEKYKSSRFSERISMLNGFLPEFIVENRNAYGLLSKGVHELDEKTCIEYFPVLNSAIELIAEEKLARVQIEIKKNNTKAALGKMSNEVSQQA